MKDKRSYKKAAILLGIILSFAIFAYAKAAFDERINYQGKLTNTANGTVNDGQYLIKFELFTTSTGGAAIWTENRSGGNKIQITNGLFSVLLGEISSLSAVNFNQDLWLEVSIGTSSLETMTPRKHVGAVPAAFEAKRLNGQTWDAPGAIGGTTPSSGVFTSITSTNILNVIGNSYFNTIASGTWQGSVIATAYGGTGTSTLGSAGSMAYSNGTSLAYTATGTVGYLLQANASGAPTWISTSSLGIAGLPSGSSGQTLRYNGSAWVASSLLYNDGTNIGIGTTTPLAALDVNGSVILGGFNRYLNFGSTTGSSGYGFYDNGGVIQFKNTGGSWINIPTSTGAGTYLNLSDWNSATPTWNNTSALVSVSSSNWNTAYSWGNHALAGYLTTSTGLTVSNFLSPNISQWNNNSGYLTSSTLPGNETDPLSLHLNQTIPQTIIGGIPNFSVGLQGSLYDNAGTPALSIDTNNRLLTIDTLNYAADYSNLGNFKIGDESNLYEQYLTFVANDGVDPQTGYIAYRSTDYEGFVFEHPILDNLTDTFVSIDPNGRILYSTADSKKSVDWENRELYASDGTTMNLNYATPGKVGIGTTTPVYRLDVYGDINTTGTYRMAGVDYGQYFIDSSGTPGQIWQSDGVGRGQWVNTSSLGFATSSFGNITWNNATGTNAYLSGVLRVIGNSYFNTIASGTWQGSVIATAYGGTGTSTAPTFGQLLIGNGSGGYNLVTTSSLGLGAAGSNGHVQFNNGGVFGATSAFYWDNNNTSLSIGNSIANGNNHLQINVGSSIPTVSAVSSMLELDSESGNVGDFNIRLSATGTGAYPAIYFTRSRGTLASPVISQNNDIIGEAIFQGYFGTDFQKAATIRATVDGNPSTWAVPGKLSFYTAPDIATGTAPIERMTIRNTGNVGIGTTSPQNVLHVNGGISIDSTTPATTSMALYNLGGQLYWNGSAFSTSSLPSGTLGQTLYYGAGGWAATSSLYVSSSGFIGIGTTNPSYDLDLGASGAILKVGGTTSGTGGRIRAREYASYSGTIFGVAEATDSSVISTKFTFRGPVNFNNALRDSGDTARIGLNTTGDNITITGTTRIAGALSVSATTSFAGNVGIGTTSPAATLDVWGTMNVSATSTLATTTITSSTITTANIATLNATNATFTNATSTILVATNYVSSSQLFINNTSTLSGPVRLGSYMQYTTAGDNYLYFNNVTTTYLKWDNANSRFALSNSLSVSGTVSSTALVINGNGTTTGSYYFGSTINVVGTSTMTTTTINSLLLADGTSTAPSLSFINDTGIGLFHPSGDGLAFSTSGTERMRMLKNGNIGIGTTTPAYSFTLVNGDIAIVSSTDGRWVIGPNAFPNRSVNTDAVALNMTANSSTWNAGLLSEVNGRLLSYGINVSQLGNRNTSSIGAIFRLDTRVATPYWSIKRQAVGTTTENADMQIAQTGEIGFGGFANDTNSFLGQVHILSATGTTVGLAVQATTSQTAALQQWINSAGTVVGEAKNLSTIFGMSMEAGAFIDRNSYVGEEFSKDRTDLAVAATGSQWVWGDYLSWSVDRSGPPGGGCTISAVDDAVNGIGRIAMTAASTICNAYHGSSAAILTPNLIFNATNRPVLLMKVRPQAASANDDTLVGLQDNSQIDVNAEPNNGIFFSNNNTGNWYGITRSGSASTAVNCGVAISLTQFALLKIEVVSTTQVKFYVDADTSDGVNYTYCGQSTTTIPVVGLSSMLKWFSTTNGRYLDVDFYRVWQDDSVSDNSLVLDQPTIENLASSTDTGVLVPELSIEDKLQLATSTLNIRVDSLAASTAKDISDIRAVLSDYQTVLADNVSSTAYLSNQVGVLNASAQNTQELLNGLNNRVTVLENNYSSTSLTMAGLQAQINSTAAQQNSSSSSDDLLQGGYNGNISANDLAVSGLAVFNGAVKVVGQMSLGADNAGQAKILVGATSTLVTFTTPYETLPIITVTPIGVRDLRFGVSDITTSSFVIQIEPPQIVDTTFNWLAFGSAMDARVFVSDGTTSSVNFVVSEVVPPPEIIPEPVLPPLPPADDASSGGEAGSTTVGEATLPLTPDAPAMPEPTIITVDNPPVPETQSPESTPDIVVSEQPQTIPETAPVISDPTPSPTPSPVDNAAPSTDAAPAG